MIVKKYIGNSIDEVEKMMEQELGSQAIILTSRLVKEKGLKGILAKKKIEIVAAVDDVELSPSEPLQLQSKEQHEVRKTDPEDPLLNETKKLEDELHSFKDDLLDWYEQLKNS